jgi:hypothetical protein
MLMRKEFARWNSSGSLSGNSSRNLDVKLAPFFSISISPFRLLLCLCFPQLTAAEFQANGRSSNLQLWLLKVTQNEAISGPFPDGERANKRLWLLVRPIHPIVVYNACQNHQRIPPPALKISRNRSRILKCVAPVPTIHVLPDFPLSDIMSTRSTV